MASETDWITKARIVVAFATPRGVSWGMPILTILWLVTCALGIALSAKSTLVLGPRSRATALGWVLTALYFVIAGVDAIRAERAPYHVDYVVLAALTIAFVVAGVRDEPQAEPWYWPNSSGLTGKERRAKRL